IEIFKVYGSDRKLKFSDEQFNQLVSRNFKPIGHELDMIEESKTSSLASPLSSGKKTNKISTRIKKLMAFIFLIFMTSITGYFIYKNTGRSELKHQLKEFGLSPEDSAFAMQLIDTPSAENRPRVHLFFDSKNMQKSKVLIVSNQTGLKYRLNLKGIAPTLVGHMNFFKTIDLNINHEFSFFDLNSSLQIQSLPRGRFDVTIECVNCDIGGDQITLFRGEIFSGDKGSGYLNNLNDYHNLVIKKADSEFLEIGQILNVLTSQYKNVRRLLNNKNFQSEKRNFKIFKKEWGSLQAQITNAFKELESTEFLASLVYPEAYLKLKELNDQIVKYFNFSSESRIDLKSKHNIELSNQEEIIESMFKSIEMQQKNRFSEFEHFKHLVIQKVK
ncbi:MAG: hypothetical protein KDD45_12055, partial [Bdellovibrionales bacterium]|nr:hypothetical protein [Bdellovibrionales bacterium]